MQPAAQFAYPLYKNLIQTSSQAGEPENSDGRVNLNMIPFKIDETVYNDTGAVPARTIADPFLGAPPGAFQTATSIYPVPTNSRMGYDQHWSLGVQRELPKGIAVEANYVGNKGSFWNSFDDVNDPSPGPGSVQNRRPYPLFGTIAFNSQDMSSNYHSLQGKVEKRYSSGLSFLASYTFSKAMQNAPSPAVGGNTAFETSRNAASRRVVSEPDLSIGTGLAA